MVVPAASLDIDASATTAFANDAQNHTPQMSIRGALLIFAVLTAVGIAAFTGEPVHAAPVVDQISIRQISSVDGDNSTLMLDQPAGDLPVVDDARWSSSLTDNSLLALLWWVVLLLVLQVAGLPWAHLIFRNLGKRRTGFARLIAWLLPAWIVWILASLELIAFRAIWCGMALIGFGVVGWLWWTRSHPELSARAAIRSAFVGGEEVTFGVVFSLFLIFRFLNPDSWHPIWGGEKPMEFAHINAMLRTAHFPPYDPWFADGILNYYYYGSYLVAFLMKLTGIPSEIAFNLAQPTVIALLASGVYSVVSALASPTSEKLTARVGGILGVVALLIMGNLVAARNLVSRLPEIPVPEFVEWTWNPSRAIAGAITEFPYFTALYADLHAHVVALPITVLVIGGGLELFLSARDESTWRSFLQRLTPLFVLMSLCLGALSATNAWDVPLYAALVVASIWTAVETRGSFLSSGIRTAGLSVILFLVGAIAFLPFHRRYVALFSHVDTVRAPTAPSEWLLHLGGLLALAALGLVWLALDNHVDTAAISTYRAVALVSGIGLGSVVLAVYVERRLTANAGLEIAAASVAVGLLLLAAWLVATHIGGPLWTFAAYAAAVVAIVFIASAGWTILAIGAAVACLGATLWLLPFEREMRFAGLLMAAAGSAITGVELVFVVDDLAADALYYRMNTVFKIYNEVWITLGIAAAALSARVVAAALEVLSEDRSESALECDDDVCVDAPGASPWVWSVPLAAVAVVIVAAGIAYPVMATGPRLDQRFDGHPPPRSLNALDWMEYGTLTTSNGDTVRFDSDRAVIDWFNSEVAGTPVIAEASIGAYRGNGSRISNATGLPTVLGWFRHELQQRYQGDLETRYFDLQRLYNATDPAEKMALIDQYDIRYIIVGDVERFSVINDATGARYASPEGLATFDAMLGDQLEIAFQSGTTTVYRVIPEER